MILEKIAAQQALARSLHPELVEFLDVAKAEFPNGDAHFYARNAPKTNGIKLSLLSAKWDKFWKGKKR